MLSDDEATKAWSCGKCKSASDGDAWRALRNCDDESNANIGWLWMPSLRRCPWSQIDAEAEAIVEAWIDWRIFGATAWGPTPLDAPNAIFEALRMCEVIRREVERAQGGDDAANRQQ